MLKGALIDRMNIMPIARNRSKPLTIVHQTFQIRLGCRSNTSEPIAQITGTPRNSQPKFRTKSAVVFQWIRGSEDSYPLVISLTAKVPTITTMTCRPARIETG